MRTRERVRIKIAGFQDYAIGQVCRCEDDRAKYFLVHRSGYEGVVILGHLQVSSFVWSVDTST